MRTTPVRAYEAVAYLEHGVVCVSSRLQGNMNHDRCVCKSVEVWDGGDKNRGGSCDSNKLAVANGGEYRQQWVSIVSNCLYL